LVVAVAEGESAGRVRFVDTGQDQRSADLAALVAAVEAEHHPRWVLPAADELYPALLAKGVTLRRCHDLALTEAILLASTGDGRRPKNLAAAYARLGGLP
jgi:DNA polymerase-1